MCCRGLWNCSRPTEPQSDRDIISPVDTFNNWKFHPPGINSESLLSKVNPCERMKCAGDGASACESALTLPGQCSAVTSATLSFSPNSNAALQVRTDRCQDCCGSSVFLPPLIFLFFFFAPSVPIVSDMGNMLSYLDEGRDNTRQERVERSPRCRDKSSHVKRHRPQNISVGAVRMMPLQGDSVIWRVCYAVAPVQHGARYSPHPCLVSSARSLLLSLTSPLIAPRTPSC